ncbi:hypothetical protein CSKR_104184 [Clonorchis sinensis]|uniref:Uncharacterized protein n=1 Tax=Clonorchis sinensis TaxID=79923 RepID=A0A3R7CYL5_CLOSI|nr:hypothetical protein CSKR_104184 [Clonorchis sinensis]
MPRRANSLYVRHLPDSCRLPHPKIRTSQLSPQSKINISGCSIAKVNLSMEPSSAPTSVGPSFQGPCRGQSNQSTSAQLVARQIQPQ